MIELTFNVDNISTVISIYNQIGIQRADEEAGTYTTVSGLGPITLVGGTSLYTVQDIDGTATNWYRSRYENSSTLNYSSWSDPVLGSTGELYYNPLYPEEVVYTSAEQLVIDRIRRLAGDPIRLMRDHGPEASANIHSDCLVYELPEKGWPVDIHMNDVSYNDGDNPVVNGYRYLQFPCTISGCDSCTGEDIGVSVWYHTFRYSDRQIMEAYDTCPPPAGLTTATATSEHYMLQTAIDLLMQENWEYSGEDGAVVRDADSLYDPTPGFRFRGDLIDKLQKRLDRLVDVALLSATEGVLID